MRPHLAQENWAALPPLTEFGSNLILNANHLANLSTT